MPRDRKGHKHLVRAIAEELMTYRMTNKDQNGSMHSAQISNMATEPATNASTSHSSLQSMTPSGKVYCDAFKGKLYEGGDLYPGRLPSIV